MAERAQGQGARLAVPLAGAAILVILAAVCFRLIWIGCLRQTGGQFAYAIDDPYIHLAIARNFALHGVWGVTPYGATNASSSPLWVLVLALPIRIFGDWVYWPLVFGMACSLAAVLFLYSRFLKIGIGAPLAVIACFAVFAAGPLDILPFTGMEHSLQILLDLVFAFWLLDKFQRPTEGRDIWPAIILSGLICLSRFEDGFLVVVPFVVCLLRRDWRIAGALAIGPILAIGGFGLFAHLSGMPAVPNSIVLKGNVPFTFRPWQGNYPWYQAIFLILQGWFEALYMHLRGRSLHLFDLFMVCVLATAALRLPGLRKTTFSLQILLWTICVACMLHAGMAAIGFFYRYEAYLIVLTLTGGVLALKEFVTYRGDLEALPVKQVQWIGAVAGVILLQFVLAWIFWFYQLGLNLIVAVYGIGLYSLVAMETGPKTTGRLLRSFVWPLMILALFFPARDRSLQAYADLPDGSRNFYLQQYQMSRFVARYYPDCRLGANDIGALTYFTHVRLLDLWGLATNSVRELKLDNQWNSTTIKRVLDDFKPDLVIAYPQWFRHDRSLPASLIPVASWTIPTVTSMSSGAGAARPVVMFYAPSPAAATRLRGQLADFQKSLPALITVRYGADAVKNVPLI